MHHLNINTQMITSEKSLISSFVYSVVDKQMLLTRKWLRHFPAYKVDIVKLNELHHSYKNIPW